MKPPPPILPASGRTTSSANATATAASVALPPCFRMSRPAWLARGCALTTIACGAVAGRERSVQVAGISARPRTTRGAGVGCSGLGGLPQAIASRARAVVSFRIQESCFYFPSMTNRDFSDPRPTEQRNPRTERIDVASSLEIVDLMNAEDATIAGIVRGERERIAQAIDLIVDAIRNGGRVVYVGAGTSGRLGVLDAAECPPTFGVPPTLVTGVIAGGYPALVKSAEGAEDDANAGGAAMDTAGVTKHDVVIGIAASGTTPYVRMALGRAQTIGASTVFVTCGKPP